MNIDKFSKPIIQEPTNPLDKRNLAAAEEVIPNQTEAEKVFLDVQDALKAARETLPPNARILEIGTGTGNLLKYMLQHKYDIVGVDARPRHSVDLPVAKARLERLPFADQTFDALISSAVFGKHFYEQQQVLMMNEIYRVLKPRGIYIAIGDRVGKNVPHMELFAHLQKREISVFRSS